MSRMWGTGWRQYFFSAIWLFYLAQTFYGVHRNTSGAAAALGYLLIVAFAALYLIALPRGWSGRSSRVFWPLFAAAAVLIALIALFAHEDALVCNVYLAVLAVGSRTRAAIPIVGVLLATTLLLPRFVPGWGHQIDWGSSIALVLVAVAMNGFFMLISANIELSRARAEVARLAAENERSRIARDLHDLLGHSLTTITVKAGLARRLAERDAARARHEITEVEQLARRTLGEVRSAVSGYREVTLAGEIASAREVMRAAGIGFEAPGAVDIVETDALATFGWVVRESVTNVVRHSRAEHCAVTLGARWIEIRDDGRGANPAGSPGHGLTGLRERVGDAGTVFAGAVPGGWLVHVELHPVPDTAQSAGRRDGVGSALDAG